MYSRAGTSTWAIAALMAALTFAAALLAPAAPAAPLVHGASAATAAPAGARLLACRQSPSINQRSAVVGTWMRPLATARRLALRIDLYQRNPGARWTLRSDVPGLGTWTTPSDALVGTRAGDVFKYRQAVGRLVVPAAYRFHVAFRWLDANDAVVREAARTTAVCRQPDLRPDLVLDSVSATPAPHGGGLVRYVLLVGNEGRTAVAHATIAATFPGDTTPGLHLRTLGRLAPGETVPVAFTGPGCASGGQPAAFLADPPNALDEVHEANNALTASCSLP
jgi:CARDB